MCENNLFDLVVFTKKHATNLSGYISDLTAGDDQNEYVKRKQVDYNLSIIDQKKVKTSLGNAVINLDRVQGFIDELKPI